MHWQCGNISVLLLLLILTTNVGKTLLTGMAVTDGHGAALREAGGVFLVAMHNSYCLPHAHARKVNEMLSYSLGDR